MRERFGLERDPARFGPTDTLTLRATSETFEPALHWLRHEAMPRFRRFEFCTAVDDRPRGAGFRTIYHLAALEPGKPSVRLSLDLDAGDPHQPTATGVYPVADWYERETADMFGVRFDGHPDPRRLYMPDNWPGHPLRKDHPYRGSEMAPFTEADARAIDEAINRHSRIRAEDDDTMVMNMGPHHPATHGVLRIVLRLDGEDVVDLDLDVGYHHRGPEKIAERQTYHRFLPYTDRIDYLSGVSNNLPYVMAVEKLLGIEVPARAQAIRVLLLELFRIINHQVYVGTYAQDCGALTPVFYTFEHREQILDFVAKVTGGRMHPSWFRIGGVTQDLPDGWREDMEAWLEKFPGQLREVEQLLTGNPIFVGRTRGTGTISLDDAIDAGFSGPNLRACGLEWDLRKATPYCGYEQYEFDVPTAPGCDNEARYLVHMEEMRQSHRIIEQVVRTMPDGDYVDAGLSLLDPRTEADAARHRVADPSLRQRVARLRAAGGGGLRRHRGAEGRERLLRRQQRQQPAVPRVHPHTVLSAHAGAAHDGEGREGAGPGGDARRHRFRAGRHRQMSAQSASAPGERARLRERIVDVLWEIQEKRGFVDDDGVREAARQCDLTPAEVDEVATFYNLIHRRPAGRLRIYVCDSISCELNGAPQLMAKLSDLLGIAPGQVTADGQVGLLPTVCLGHCDRAPCAMVANRIVGPLPVDRAGLERRLEEWRHE